MISVTKETLALYDRCGYKTIHLLGSLYLVRRYSTKYTKFSVYDLAIVK